MYADEDRRRLLESRHDVGACEDPATLTNQSPYQQAITASRAELAAARDGLKAAAALVSVEKSETEAERAKLQQAVAAAVRRYAHTRGLVQNALLNVDPDIPITAAELTRRTRLFERVFKLAASDFDRISQRAVIEAIGAVVKSLADEADLKPLNLAAPLTSAHAAAEAAAKELDREIKDDDTAMTGLRAARAAFDRAAEAHALLIESVLVRERRDQEMGRFVLAKDAAYAARRAARAPIGEEAGSGEIDAESKDAAAKAPVQPAPSP